MTKGQNVMPKRSAKAFCQNVLPKCSAKTFCQNILSKRSAKMFFQSILPHSVKVFCRRVWSTKVYIGSKWIKNVSFNLWLQNEFSHICFGWMWKCSFGPLLLLAQPFLWSWNKQLAGSDCLKTHHNSVSKKDRQINTSFLGHSIWACSYLRILRRQLGMHTDYPKLRRIYKSDNLQCNTMGHTIASMPSLLCM